MLIALQGAVSQGVLWGIMVLGVFITFRLLDIPDMTCDGSFALGGCVCAVLIVNNNVDPLLAVLAGMCAGAIAGAVTGILTTVFEIPAILAGILTQISLWSVNLRIMGKSNTPILAKGTIFSSVSNMTGLPQSTVGHLARCGYRRHPVLVLWYRDRLGASRHRQQRVHDPRLGR